MKLSYILIAIVGVILLGGVAYLAMTPANVTQSEVSTDVNLDQPAPAEEATPAEEAAPAPAEAAPAETAPAEEAAPAPAEAAPESEETPAQ